MSFLDQHSAGGPLGYGCAYPKGTRITCPSCGHLIAVAARDIMVTDPGHASDWHSPYPLAGFASTCPECGTNQLRVNPGDPTTFQVHTPEGWK